MLFEADIDCHIVQSRNDTYKIFGGNKADLPIMNEIEDKYISIPIGMHVTEEDAHYIANCIKKGWGSFNNRASKSRDEITKGVLNG